MPSKRIAIVQSNYIPWKGYFDLIRAVDEFVLLDTVQYTRRDWRNRNIIKTPAGPQWLTIPVLTKGRYVEPILSIHVADDSWRTAHWKTLVANYSRAAWFRTYAAVIEPLYLQRAESQLSAINRRFIEGICGILAIPTKISSALDYEVESVLHGGEPNAQRTDRLLAICRQAGADTYVSGPSAQRYIDPQRFLRAQVELVYFDYEGYAEYPQLYPPFDHRVSVLDLIFNTGPAARRHMKTMQPSVHVSAG